jgi:flagellar assembly factor FliW
MADVTLSTSRFGEVQVAEDRIIRFLTPIFGFEQFEQYVLLDHADQSPFRWLQAVQEPDLAFVVTNPKFFGIHYEFPLSEEVADQLGITQAEDAQVLTIVNIPQDNPGKMTANLLGPLVVNLNNKIAMQIVLNDAEYSTKVRLIPDELLAQSDAEAEASSASGKEG